MHISTKLVFTSILLDKVLKSCTEIISGSYKICTNRQHKTIFESLKEKV